MIIITGTTETGPMGLICRVQLQLLITLVYRATTIHALKKITAMHIMEIAVWFVTSETWLNSGQAISLQSPKKAEFFSRPCLLVLVLENSNSQKQQKILTGFLYNRYYNSDIRKYYIEPAIIFRKKEFFAASVLSIVGNQF